MNEFLRFYGSNQISPVSQKLDDLRLHFGRRIGLYRTLGLAASLFEGREILEVAPGSGHNSIVTATFNAKSYDLVEPNPTGFRNMVNLFAEHRLPTDAIRFFNTRLDNFPEKKTYDIVICEGLIPGLSDQDEFVRQLASRVREGGILVVTCADAISVFFESLRRYLAQLLIREFIDDLEERNMQQRAVGILLSAFRTHLDALKGMSRPPEDWIWDNMLNPAALQHPAKNEFSVEKCLDFLGNDFYFYGSSPVFMNNWSWYKNLPLDPRDYNKPFAVSFAAQRHNLLHCEETGPSATMASDLMYRHCKMFALQMEKRTPREWAEINAEDIGEDLAHVRQVFDITRKCGLQKSMLAIDEFLALFDNRRIPDAEAIAGMTGFRGAFGRGQQYVSLVKV